MTKQFLTILVLTIALKAHGQWSSSIGRVYTTLSNNNVGIGTSVPSSRLHIVKEETGIQTNYATVAIEANDAHLDITSDAGGSWGSAINFVEGAVSTNANVWSIIRQTSSFQSNLMFNYGTGNNPLGNPTMMTISKTGNVGIGTTNPAANLHVAGKGIRANRFATNSNIDDVVNDSPWYGMGRGNFMDLSYNNHKPAVQLAGYYGLLLKTKHGELAIHQNGNVGIGTTSPDTKLAVNGTIHAKEVRVDLNNWSDYVFTSSYNLLSLEEVKLHIQEKGHLPNVPSAEEVEENGINLGEMNAKLLEKVEELTLYLIEVKEEVKMVTEENRVLKNRIEKLEEK